MALGRHPRAKPWQIGSPTLLLLFFAVAVIALTFLFLAFSSTSEYSFFNSSSSTVSKSIHNLAGSLQFHGEKEEKYLYWGYRIDCPGKFCDSCAGLGHQESSLRCALEEAMVLGRTFVMPSRMCLNPVHNNKGRLANSTKSENEWMSSSCPMDSLYDVELISQKVPVVLDNSKTWHQVLFTAMKLGARGVAHVESMSRSELLEDRRYADILLINRTASPLSWFAECRNRKNQSSILLPHMFLPSMAAKKLREAADKIKSSLGDYDAIHVRRGDIMKTRKDRFGVVRSRHPHVARDTQPEYILQRIAKWIPPGRTLYIASNERKPGFFSPLGTRYKMAYSSNYSTIVDPVVENNYQLFMIERLIMMGAKTFINTFKEDNSEYSLCDDPKKAKSWQKVVHTMEEDDHADASN